MIRAFQGLGHSLLARSMVSPSSGGSARNSFEDRAARWGRAPSTARPASEARCSGEARPIASICSRRPRGCPPSDRRVRPDRNSVWMRSSVRGPCTRRSSGTRPSRGSRGGQRLEHLPSLRTWRAQMRAVRGPVDKRFSPLKVIAPDTGGTTPLIVLNSVDFPGSVGATSVTKRPSATDRVTLLRPAGRRKRPKVLYFEHRGSDPTHAGAPATSCPGRPRSRRVLDDGAVAGPPRALGVVEHHEPVGSRIIACIVCSMMQIVVPCSRIAPAPQHAVAFSRPSPASVSFGSSSGDCGRAGPAPSAEAACW